MVHQMSYHRPIVLDFLINNKKKEQISKKKKLSIPLPDPSDESFADKSDVFISIPDILRSRSCKYKKKKYKLIEYIMLNKFLPIPP